MDLTFANRIDTDLATQFVTGRTPTGILMLDRVLARTGAREDPIDTRRWIEVLAAEDAVHTREQASLRLIERVLPENPHGCFRWPFGSLRAIPDRRRHRRLVRAFIAGRRQRAKRETRLAVAEVLLDDDIPDPGDAALIGLIGAGARPPPTQSVRAGRLPT